MGIKDVFKNVFNVDIEYEDEDEDFEEEETIKVLDDRKAASPKRSFGAKALPIVTGSGSTVILCEPEEFNDSPEICDNLKSGVTVVVNMETVEASDAKKIFDFLSGAIYVLEGSMKKVADNVFILAPKGVDIKTNEASGSSSSWEFE